MAIVKYRETVNDSWKELLYQDEFRAEVINITYSPSIILPCNTKITTYIIDVSNNTTLNITAPDSIDNNKIGIEQTLLVNNTGDNACIITLPSDNIVGNRSFVEVPSQTAAYLHFIPLDNVMFSLEVAFSTFDAPYAGEVLVFNTPGTFTVYAPSKATYVGLFIVGGGGSSGQSDTNTSMYTPTNGGDSVVTINGISYTAQGGAHGLRRKYVDGVGASGNSMNGVPNPFDIEDNNLYGAGGSRSCKDRYYKQDFPSVGTHILTTGGETGGGYCSIYINALSNNYATPECHTGTFYGAGGAGYFDSLLINNSGGGGNGGSVNTSYYIPVNANDLITVVVGEGGIFSSSEPHLCAGHHGIVKLYFK